ncbi:AbiH family protein [Flavobacterium tibetense]|uniref:AbiH family protein n=1 Tax=Flavobacterium tibetense TaxID=2233533 RepID=UPI0013001A01|nr:AbiH family protein [Flavobacterium tibetense]
MIIGNGFDLAHGLPTRYSDFIEDYWRNVKDSNHNGLVSFNLDNFVEFKNHKNIDELIDEIAKIKNIYKRDGIEVYKIKENPTPLANNRIQIINYKNKFFKLMSSESIENWVDIKNLYYKTLKERAKGELQNQNYILGIKQLNEDFEEIKNLFESYLIRVFEESYNWEKIKNDEIIQNLIEDTKFNDFSFDIKQEEYFNNLDNFSIENTTLLSFNYTKTVFDYSEEILKSKFDIYYNYIHGKIDSKDLPIIFGFGDEMDKEYQLIEDIDDNEYLKNFKSIQYLEHSNYKNLYSFIESGPFQVFIMGHSCGLSDRTLLSTIFENENCLSMKVFYYQYLDKQTNKIKDNYTEITQNISRHFKDKKMLRKKVVEKRHCKPLIKFQETKS